MSVSPTPVAPPTSKINTLLNVLNAASGLISIAVPIAGTIIPIIVQIVKSIRGSGAAQTIEYSLVVVQDQGALDAIITAGGSDLDLINAELTRLGLPVLVKP